MNDVNAYWATAEQNNYTSLEPGTIYHPWSRVILTTLQIVTNKQEKRRHCRTNVTYRRKRWAAITMTSNTHTHTHTQTNNTRLRIAYLLCLHYSTTPRKSLNLQDSSWYIIITAIITAAVIRHFSYVCRMWSTKTFQNFSLKTVSLLIRPILAHLILLLSWCLEKKLPCHVRHKFLVAYLFCFKFHIQLSVS